MRKTKGYNRWVKFEVEEITSRFYQNKVGEEFINLLFLLKGKLGDVTSLKDLDEILKQKNFGFKFRYDKISGNLYFYRDIEFENVSIFEFESFRVAKINYDTFKNFNQYEVVEILKEFVECLYSQTTEKINNPMNKDSLSLDEQIFQTKLLDK